MCEQATECEVCKGLEKKHHDTIVKYWGVISGMAALIITIILFYANTIHATNQVTEHESRIRDLERIATEDVTTLKLINTRIERIETKVDKILYNK